METQIPFDICKRDASRKPTEAIVRCQPYTSCGTARSANGVMRNFSSDDAYIETTTAFRSGMTLFLRMLRYPPARLDADDADRPRSICLAEVKWQQSLADTDAMRYGMGVRYLE